VALIPINCCSKITVWIYVALHRCDTFLSSSKDNGKQISSFKGWIIDCSLRNRQNREASHRYVAGSLGVLLLISKAVYILFTVTYVICKRKHCGKSNSAVC